MSASNFDILCQLWAASLSPYNDAPPFANHTDLCKTIDATPVGGIPWRSITLSYNGIKPDNAPPWMQMEHTVWYRDPRMLFKNMLANPEFAGHFDYAPSRRYDTNDDRVYEHFMSSDWAWKQAVSDISIVTSFVHGI
jgi:Plavaka transposase